MATKVRLGYQTTRLSPLLDIEYALCERFAPRTWFAKILGEGVVVGNEVPRWRSRERPVPGCRFSREGRCRNEENLI